MKDFYIKNCKEYYEATVDLDPAPFLTPFVKFLKPGASVLDVGCGSGRDLLWFARQGFYPVGFEKSWGLAELAKHHSCCPVMSADFYSYDFSVHEFDAITLVGALVHVPSESLPTVFQSICQSLRPGGMVLITLKEGIGEFCAEDGRIFTLWEQEELDKTFMRLQFEIADFSRRISQLRSNEHWLGYVLKKQNG